MPSNRRQLLILLLILAAVIAAVLPMLWVRDVEGPKGNVLQRAENTIRMFQPLTICEASTKAMRDRTLFIGICQSHLGLFLRAALAAAAVVLYIGIVRLFLKPVWKDLLHLVSSIWQKQRYGKGQQI